jgi:integrase
VRGSAHSLRRPESYFIGLLPRTQTALDIIKRYTGDTDSAGNKLGLGKFNPKTWEYTGLTPHDFRRSAARNLIQAGVDRRVAMKISHKTGHIFERYNIRTTEDVREALIKVGRYKPASIASIG